MKKDKMLVISWFAAAFTVLVIIMMVMARGSADEAARAVLDKITCGAMIAFGVTVVFAINSLLLAKADIRAWREGLSPQEKLLYVRGALVTALSFIMALTAAAIGARTGLFGKSLSIGMLAAAGAFPPLLLLVSVLSAKSGVKRINDMNVREKQVYLREKREASESAAKATGKTLKRIRFLIYLMAAFALLSGLLFAFAGGCLGSKLLAAPIVLYASTLAAVGLVRLIPFPAPALFMKDEGVYVSEKDYPCLYRIARDTARDMGFKGRIRIGFTADGNVGVLRVGNSVSLLLGVFALGVVSEDELRSILRHEFSHVEADRRDREGAFYKRMSMGKPRHPLGAVEENYYAYPDVMYLFTFSVNDYASSVLNESKADMAMTEGFSKETAASALVKIAYYDLFEYEAPARGANVLDYSAESAPRDLVSARIADFREQTKKRADFWNGLLEKEIQSRSSTHPTTRMRLDALGARDIKTLPYTGSADYTAEAEKSAAKLDAESFRELCKSWEDDRREKYEEPMKTLEEWRGEGEPLKLETYASIVGVMRSLGLVKETDAFCERVIKELPTPATYYARYVLGLHKLERYEKDGVDLLYEAVENNNNALEPGLDAIGRFLCLTGDQNGLDRYREKAVELLQQDVDLYSETGILKKGDRLSKESLPEGMLEKDLAYFDSVGQGRIEKVFLVKKTITDDFSTSAYVIKFTDGANKKDCGEIMNTIFTYLDTTTDWQYSLFRYEDVMKAGFEKIDGALVYEKK